MCTKEQANLAYREVSEKLITKIFRSAAVRWFVFNMITLNLAYKLRLVF